MKFSFQLQVKVSVAQDCISHFSVGEKAVFISMDNCDYGQFVYKVDFSFHSNVVQNFYEVRNWISHISPFKLWQHIQVLISHISCLCFFVYFQPLTVDSLTTLQVSNMFYCYCPIFNLFSSFLLPNSFLITLYLLSPFLLPTIFLTTFA